MPVQKIDLPDNSSAVVITEHEDDVIGVTVLSNIDEDSDTPVWHIAMGVSEIIRTDPDTIVGAYQEWAKDNIKDNDDPDWAQDIKGTA